MSVVNLDQVQNKYLIKTDHVSNLDQVQNKYLIKADEKPVVKVNQVQNKYLIKTEPESKLDQVQNRYLIKVHKGNLLKYTKSPEDYLVSSLHKQMYLPIKGKYISFSDMENLPAGSGHNASIKISVTEESGFKGSIRLNYIKADISDIVVGRDIVDTFRPPLNDLASSTDMLRHFNSHFGTKITPSEIVDSPIVGDGDVKLIASEGSLLFIPGTEVNLGVYSGGDRYGTLPKNTLTWSEDILEGIWTQGLDISLMYKGLTSYTTYVSTISDEFIRQFYDDVSEAPVSTHPRLTSRSLTQRSTTAPIISDRSRTDCVYAVTVVPSGTASPIIFHYDTRQR